MRFATAAAPTAILAALFLTAAPALAQDAAPAPAAMKTVQSVAATVQNGTPTEDQQAQMASAVQNSGLAVERFNAISAAVSADPVLQARAAVAGATPSAPGSVGAGVTDAEAGQFAAAIQNSGLEIERFNAISAATAQDEHLQARIALAQTRQGE